MVYAENESINFTNTTLLLNITQDTENITGFHDLRLETNINDKINIETNYDKFFKITYLNHTKGEEEQVPVFVYYNITKNNSILKEAIFNVTVNSYTSANTGEYFFNDTGNFTICGEIISAGINESNFENNKACKDFIVISTFNVSCDISLTIETEKLVYENGEKIGFRNILSNESFNYRIEYWVEDLFGEVFKKRYETSNLNKKSYTPKIETKVEVLKVIANISYLACNDSNKSDNYYETIVIVKGKPKEEEKTGCEACKCKEETTSEKKSKKTELELIEVPEEFIVGEDFITKILIINNDDVEHEYEVWSYVYRGSKCYSESRENNKIKTIIKASESKIIELNDNIKKADDGEYNIKVKVKQDNLKGEKELKDSIKAVNIIENKEDTENKEEQIKVLEVLESENNLNPPEIQEYTKEEIDAGTVPEKIDFDYVSSSEKSKKLIKYFILTTLALVVIIIVVKNEQ